MGKCAVPIQAGSKFGATCSANGRAIAWCGHAAPTLANWYTPSTTRPCTTAVTSRLIQRLDPDVFELVRAQSYDRSATAEIWEGDAEVQILPGHAGRFTGDCAD